MAHVGRCKTCKETFESKNPQKFCSRACMYEGRDTTKYGRKHKHKATKKKCQGCGKLFVCTTAYEVEKQSHCSQKCYLDNREYEYVDRECLYCGDTMVLVPSSTQTFCSASCRSSHYVQGPGNPAWKGGIGNNGGYWKPKVRARDKHRCQVCDITQKKYGRTLPVHHIIPVACGGGHVMENMITLCQPCHVRVERAFLVSVIKASGLSSRRLKAISRKVQATAHEVLT